MKKQTFEKKNFSEIFATATEAVPRVSTYGDYHIYTCVDIKGQAQIVVIKGRVDDRDVPTPTLRIVIESIGESIKILNVYGEFTPAFVSMMACIKKKNADYSVNTLYGNTTFIFEDWAAINNTMEIFCKYLYTVQKLNRFLM